MSHEYAEHTLSQGNGKSLKKREYISPQLVHYGSVRALTRNTGGSQNIEQENTNCSAALRGTVMNCASDRRVKEGVVRIGTHSLGIGLYTFYYKPEYRAAWGRGRQFGVMADEVETVIPQAVSMHPDGYNLVNYAMLGISRSLH